MTREELLKVIDKEHHNDEDNKIINNNPLRMTAEQMISILEQVPSDTYILSDSGWECDATSCARAFYSEKFEVLVLTRYTGNNYQEEEDFIELHPKE